MVLADLHMFTPTSGVMCAHLISTREVPDSENITELHELIDFIISLNVKIDVILEFQNGTILPYLKFLPALLKHMNSVPNQVQQVEVRIPKESLGYVQLVRPLVDMFMQSDKKLSVKVAGSA